MSIACCKAERCIYSLYNAKGFCLPDCRFLALHCKPVELTYVHTLLRAAVHSCYSWSLDPVTWQAEVAHGFPEKGERILPFTQNRPPGKEEPKLHAAIRRGTTKVAKAKPYTFLVCLAHARLHVCLFLEFYFSASVVSVCSIFIKHISDMTSSNSQMDK